MTRARVTARPIANYRAAVAAEVRAEMARQQVHQSEVARALGLSEMALSRRATGKTPFTVEELATLAVVLHVDVRDLLPVGAPVLRSQRDTVSLWSKIPQPRGHVGHGLLGSWDHHALHLAPTG